MSVDDLAISPRTVQVGGGAGLLGRGPAGGARDRWAAAGPDRAGRRDRRGAVPQVPSSTRSAPATRSGAAFLAAGWSEDPVARTSPTSTPRRDAGDGRRGADRTRPGPGADPARRTDLPRATGPDPTAACPPCVTPSGAHAGRPGSRRHLLVISRVGPGGRQPSLPRTRAAATAASTSRPSSTSCASIGSRDRRAGRATPALTGRCSNGGSSPSMACMAPTRTPSSASSSDANGLPVNGGRTTSDTWSKLVVSLKPGAHGEAVAALQRLLIEKRGRRPRRQRDVRRGGDTRGPAVARFEQAHRAGDNTGTVGTATWRRLLAHLEKRPVYGSILCPYEGRERQREVGNVRGGRPDPGRGRGRVVAAGHGRVR